MRKMRSVFRGVLLLAALCVLLMLPAAALSASWTDNCENGNWYVNFTDATTYQISSAARLASVAKLVNEGYLQDSQRIYPDFSGKILKITADIDLSAYKWVPIGTLEHPFMGTIQSANGNAITGITVTSASVVDGSTRYYGLVGYGLGATVTNLTLEGTISVTGAEGKTDVVGAAIAYAGANSEVSKLTSNVAVGVSGASGTVKIGGVVGISAAAKLSGCENDGTITVGGASAATVGGLIGEVTGDTKLAGNGGGAGGDGGASSGPSRNNAKLNVTASSAAVGGIVGKVRAGTLSMTTLETDTSSATDEYAKYIWSMGDLKVTPTTDADVGGFIGTISDTGACDLREAIFIQNITVSKNLGNFSANVGGILGSQSGSGACTLTNCKFTTGLKVQKDSTVLIDVSGKNPKIDVSTASENVYTGGIYGKAEYLSVVTPVLGSDGDANCVPVIRSVGNVGGIGGMCKADAVRTDGVATVTTLQVHGTGENCSVGGAFGTAQSLKDFNLRADLLEVKSEKSGASVGGIAGKTEGVSADGSICVIGSIQVSSAGSGCSVGGFAGQNTGTLKNISLGDRIAVTCSKGGDCAAGGFVGKNGGTVDYCYATAELATISGATNLTSGLSLGGLVGINSGTVQNCYRDADVTAVSAGAEIDSYVGGLIGRNTGVVRYCYAACNVDASGIANGNAYVGGLIGFLEFGTVQNCYSAAGFTVEGSSNGAAGGLIGQRDYTTTVCNCYSGAAVIGGANKGGFFGAFSWNDLENITGCVYLLDPDADINAELSGAGGENPEWTTANLKAADRIELSDENSFTGWDFTDTWRISAAEGGAYAFPALLRATDRTTLNYDIRWYTANPKADSFTVSDDADLSGLAMLVNGDVKVLDAVSFAGKTVTVEKPFNLQTAQWISIGKVGASFAGTFDGNGMLIDGLRMTGVTDTGLFGIIATGATLKNVRLETAALSGSGNVGALIPVNVATIEAPEIILSAAVTSTGGSAGGVAGTNNGAITAPALTVGANGTLNAPAAGAVVGTNAADGTVSGGVVTIVGAVTANETNGFAGGVAGRNNGVLSGLTVTLSGTVSANCAGGVAGQNAKQIEGSTVQGSGTVTSASYAGGLVGQLTADGKVLTSEVKNITVNGSGSVGGAIGAANGTLTVNRLQLDGITVSGVKVTADSASNVGGVIGYARGVTAANLTVSDLTLNAATNGSAIHVGGVAGLAENSILRNISAKTLSVSAASTTADVYAGGVAGKLCVTDGSENTTYSLTAEDKLGLYQGVTASNVTDLTMVLTGAENDVGAKNAFAGGIVGYAEKGSVYDSSVRGDLTVHGFAAICAGGAAGQASGAYLVNNAADCGIALDYAGAYDAGGFAGKLENATARFNRVSAADAVSVAHEDGVMTGHVYVGGFAGRIINTEDWSVRENSAAQPVNVLCADNNANVYAGGFVGKIGNDTTKVYACYATGDCAVDAKAYSYVGGFVGMVKDGAVNSCYAADNALTVLSKDAYAGGFVGLVESSETTDCYAVDGTISATGTATANTGAFAGSSKVVIDRAYADVSDVTFAIGDEEAQSCDTTVILPAQESEVTLDAGTYLTGFDFDTAARKWCYCSGRNNNRPMLTALESWDSVPSLAIFREQGLEELTVSSAEQLGTAAKLLSDDSFAKLFTNGRTARGNVTVNLAADIALGEKLWTPIEALQAGDVLDGENHTISGLRSTAENFDNYGFVRTNNGTIRNLTFSDADVTAGASAGIVAGTNNGTISDITIASNATVKGTVAGGIAGANGVGGKIEASLSKANVTGSTTAGGIAGSNAGCVGSAANRGDVTSDATVNAPTVGGVVGTNSGTVQNCDWIGEESQLQGGDISSGAITGDGGYETNCRAGQCAMPTASPASSSFADKVTITLATATEDAAIYYTTDGSKPTTASTRYTAPIEISAATTIQAIAVKADTYADSNILTATYSKYTSGGGGATETTFTPTIAQKDTISVSPAALKSGEKAIVTVTPDAGFKVENLIVKDAKGNAIPVTENADGTYSFVQPDSKVTIDAVYQQIGAETETAFVDVVAGSYYESAVDWAVEKGITSGTDKAHFSPNAKCTRAQMVTFLWRAAGSPEPIAAAAFTDVAADAYYAKAVAWAAENGITTGTSKTTFSPDETVTRGQTVTFLYRAHKGAASGENPFADLAEGAFYTDAVQWAVVERITTGTSETTFSPNADCLRAQIVTFLYRAYNKA